MPKEHGGAIIFSNVSPGAAYAHDPDGHGHVYHRAGSFGPGRVPVPAHDHLDVTLDVAGERKMTDRFIDEVLYQRRPALGVLWLGEPDHIQHEAPLGSPEHLAVLVQADINAGLVIDAVNRLRAAGDDILLLIGSDHGHQTVAGVVDIDAELTAAGLKADHGSDDVMAVSNGTSALIYVHLFYAAAIPRMRAFLEASDWAGEVFGPDDLETVGQARASGLTFAVSMQASEKPNAFGIPGTNSSLPSPLWASRIGSVAASMAASAPSSRRRSFSPRDPTSRQARRGWRRRASSILLRLCSLISASWASAWMATRCKKRMAREQWRRPYAGHLAEGHRQTSR